MIDQFRATRGACLLTTGACPTTECRYHLADEAAEGRLQSYDDPCVLKASENRTYTLEEIGAAMGVTKERIRQIETKALRKLKRAVEKGRAGLRVEDLLALARFEPRQPRVG